MIHTPNLLSRASSGSKHYPVTSRQDYGIQRKLPSFIPSPRTVSIQAQKKVKELVLSQKKQDMDMFPNESPRKRIIFTNIHKDSPIEFGVVSNSLVDMIPLEPFSKAIRFGKEEENDLSLIKMSPKQALLYKRDGIDFLSCKFNKTTRDNSCHSLEVLRSDFDSFCGEMSTVQFKLPKFQKAKRAFHHRRKSCVCSWCGGASALEKAIQNHPDIPSTTICQRNFGVNADDSEINKSAMSGTSRTSNWKRKLNSSRRNTKKSIFGTSVRSSTNLDSLRSFGGLQRTSTFFSGSKKDLLSLKPRPEGIKQKKSLPRIAALPVKTEGDEESSSQRSNCSINLETSPILSNSQSPGSINLLKKRSNTLLNFNIISDKKKNPAIKPLYNFGINLQDMRTILNESVAEQIETETIQTHDTSMDLHEIQKDCLGSPVRTKKTKVSRKKKTLKSFVCSTQRIMDVYSCFSSPRSDKPFQRPQLLSRDTLSRKKTYSAASWGFNTAKTFSFSPIPAKASPRKDAQIKLDNLTFPKTVKSKKITPPMTGHVLTSPRTLKITYFSPKYRTVVTPSEKMFRVEKRMATVI